MDNNSYSFELKGWQAIVVWWYCLVMFLIGNIVFVKWLVSLA